MDRHSLAYLVLALLILGLAAAFGLSRYYSRGAVLKRRRIADEARWAEQARTRAALEPVPEPDPRLP